MSNHYKDLVYKFVAKTPKGKGKIELVSVPTIYSGSKNVEINYTLILKNLEFGVAKVSKVEFVGDSQLKVFKHAYNFITAILGE